MLFFHHLKICFNNYNQFLDQLYNNTTLLFSLKPSIADQIAEAIPHFSQVAMPGFGNIIRTRAWKVVIKTIASHAFKKTTAYAPAFEPQDCFPMMNSKDVVGQLLLPIHMIIPGFLEYFILEANIDQLVEANKLSTTLRDLTIRIFIASIREIDLYIATLQELHLTYVVFEKEKDCFYCKFGARA